MLSLEPCPQGNKRAGIVASGLTPFSQKVVETPKPNCFHSGIILVPKIPSWEPYNSKILSYFMISSRHSFFRKMRQGMILIPLCILSSLSLQTIIHC